MELSKYVNEIVKFRQSTLPSLKYLDKMCSVARLGDYVTGCEICLRNGGVSPLRNTSQCQLRCDFCYEYGKETSHIANNQIVFWNNLHTIDSFKILIDCQQKLFEGIAWVPRGEPLLEIDKIESIMPYLSGLGIYQWLYTNGLIATEETLKKLSNWGLSEIRFDLQATGFSDDIMKNVSIAIKYFPTVVVESPMFTDTYNNLIRCIDKLVDIGVTNFNLPELQVFPTNIMNFDTEGFIYRHNRGYVSPTSSIMLLYDFIDFVIDNNININVNLCTNGTKYYRGCSSGNRGLVIYPTHFNILPLGSYRFIIDKYFEMSGKSKWEIYS